MVLIVRGKEEKGRNLRGRRQQRNSVVGVVGLLRLLVT
jgi:hypothetical protein